MKIIMFTNGRVCIIMQTLPFVVLLSKQAVDGHHAIS